MRSSYPCAQNFIIPGKKFYKIDFFGIRLKNFVWLEVKGRSNDYLRKASVQLASVSLRFEFDFPVAYFPLLSIPPS